jgi:hypothetical protein
MRRIVLVLSVALVALSVAPVAFAAGWTSPAAIDSGHLLTSVSCASTSFCVAGDAVGNAFVFNGSSWSVADPVFSSAGSNPQIFSVSCAPGTEFCAAAGEVTPSGASARGAVAIYSGGIWSAPEVYGQIEDLDDFVDEINGVSCASATSCVGTDPSSQAYVTWNGTQWSEPMSVGSSFSDDSYDPGQLACPASTFCAGFNGGDVETYNGSSWSGPVTVTSDGASLFAISCPVAGFCMATASGGDAYTYNGSAWRGPSATGTGLSPWGVSCVSSSFCVAIDQTGDAGYYNGSTWTDSDTFDSAAHPSSISCTTTTFCVAVDQAGNVSYFSGVPAASGTLGGPTSGGGSGPTSSASGTVALSSATVDAGKLRITLSCAGTAGAHCAKATVAATVTEQLKGTRITAITARAKTAAKSVTIATASATLATGQSKTLSLSLNGTGRALLARFHHLATTVLVTTGGHAIARRTLHLSEASNRKR